MKRIEKSTEYVRHVFTEAERLAMGSDLAESYNQLTAIEDEEAVVKAKFKERRTTVEQKVGSLSRDLGTGWTMQNAVCRLEYDKPNVNEVSYVRIDTGEVIKTRPFTQSEMQGTLPLGAEVTSAEQSNLAITEFFGDVVDGMVPSAAKEEAAHEPPAAMPAKPKKTPKKSAKKK